MPVLDTQLSQQRDTSPVNVESQQLQELTEQKNELLGRVQMLKKDLENWRSKLDAQVKGYRNDITDLRLTLNSQGEALHKEFLELRAALKQQLDLTTGIAAQEVADAEAKLAGTSLGK